MDDHESAVGHDRPGLVAQLGRQAFNQVEQPLTPRRDVGAVLE
jgi:hypothetical protein